MELHGLMEEVKTIKTEREVIETTLRDPVADIGEREEEGGEGEEKGRSRGRRKERGEWRKGNRNRRGGGGV